MIILASNFCPRMPGQDQNSRIRKSGNQKKLTLYTFTMRDFVPMRPSKLGSKETKQIFSTDVLSDLETDCPVDKSKHFLLCEVYGGGGSV